MKKILTITLISILSSLFAQTDTDYCVRSKNLTFEEVKKLKGLKKLKEIRLVSYLGENDKEGYETIPKNAKGDVDMSKMRESILAEENIRDELVEQFFNVGFDPKLKEVEFQTTTCWVSRVAILFFDVNDKVLGHYEICFSCRKAKKYPEAFPIQGFCYGKYEKVKDIFIKAGIKYSLGECGD